MDVLGALRKCQASAEWTCVACTMSNPLSGALCGTCGTANPNPPPAPALPPAQALVKAAMEGDLQKLTAQLDAGTPVDSPNGSLALTALAAAANTGELECVRALLLRGASHAAVDAKGCTPLMHAAACDRAGVAAALLAKGAEATRKNSAGQDARSFARGKSKELVAALEAAAA